MTSEEYEYLLDAADDLRQREKENGCNTTDREHPPVQYATAYPEFYLPIPPRLP